MLSVLKRFEDLSIKSKLFLTYLLLLTISFALFISVNTYITAKNTERQTRYSLEVGLEQARSFLNYKTGSISKIMDIMVTHDTIQTIVTKRSDVYRDNIGNWLLDEYNFNQLIYNVQTNPDIQNISLYLRDGMAAIESTDQFRLLDEIKKTHWVSRIEDGGVSYLWMPSAMSDNNSPAGTITFFRKVFSPFDKGYAGLLRAEIPLTVLEQILEQSLFTQSTSALLINSHNEIIASSKHNQTGGTNDLITAVQSLSRSGQFDTIMLNGEKTLLASVPVDNTDWLFILEVPHKDIVELSKKARNQLFLIFLAVAAMTLPLAYWVSTSGTIRIRKLSKTMRRVGVDHVPVILDPKNNDEIGELTHTFNRMLTRIDNLAADKYQLGLDVKNMELRALQAQINPHFLYNTLDMVNWLAMKYHAEDIRVLITSLSDFYKISLSNGDDIISIRNELEHVEAYVRIQNMRFRNRIKLDIDVSDEMKEFSTLKLILQPLVENAILHGIMEKDSQTGTINIRGSKLEDALELIVEDDGVGMDVETVRGIMNGTLKKKSGGYGMRNIHNRLEITFGYPYGISVDSVPGSGTTIVVRLPIQM